MSVDLLGRKWDSPIVLCPVGSQKAFHPDGEIACSNALQRMHQLMLEQVALAETGMLRRAWGLQAVHLGRKVGHGFARFDDTVEQAGEVHQAGKDDQQRP